MTGMTTVASSGYGWTDWLQLAIAASVAGVAVAVPLTAYFRRPQLTLAEDVQSDYSGVVGAKEPRVRLLAKNARRKRAAHQTRVEMMGYRRHDDADWTWLGSLPLRWRGTYDPSDVTVYAGLTRPVDLGAYWEPPDGWEPRPGWPERPAPEREAEIEEASVWNFHPALQSCGRIPLAPGSWGIRVLIGAEEADAGVCDVDVSWRGDAAGCGGGVR